MDAPPIPKKKYSRMWGYIADPPIQTGSIIDSGTSWEFGFDLDPSPLTASTNPADAKFRTQCLDHLSYGLKVYGDRLAQFCEDDVRQLQPSERKNFDKYENFRELTFQGLADVRARYRAAIAAIKQKPGISDQDRFLKACLTVNLRVGELVLTRAWALQLEIRLNKLGRDVQRVDWAVGFEVWNRQFMGKVIKYCIRHPWLKLEVENVYRKVSGDDKGGEMCFSDHVRIVSNPEGLKALGVPVQLIPGLQQPDEAVLTPIAPEPSFVQRILSNFPSLVPTSWNDSVEPTPTAIAETHADHETKPGVECPICAMDLYVATTDDLFQEGVALPDGLSDAIDGEPPALLPPPPSLSPAANLVSQVGRAAHYVVNELWPPAPPQPTFDHTTGVCTEGPCYEGPNFWKEEPKDQDFVPPPQPVFCPQCKTGFHTECIWQWFQGNRLRGHKCPYCRTSIGQHHVRNVVEPKVMAERLNKYDARIRAALLRMDARERASFFAAHPYVRSWPISFT